MIHAHLDDGKVVLGLQAQQLQRQAVRVVEIALRLEHLETRAQRGGYGFLGGGLSGRAGDRDDLLPPLAAHVRGQRLQGEQRIVGNEERHGQRGIGQRGHARPRYHRGNGSALHGGSNKVVAVEALAAHGKKQLARRDGARVDRVALRDQRAGMRNARRGLQHRAGSHRGFSKRKIHCSSP